MVSIAGSSNLCVVISVFTMCIKHVFFLQFIDNEAEEDSDVDDGKGQMF